MLRVQHREKAATSSQAHLEVAWKPVRELLSIQGNLRVEIDGGCVLQQLALALHCINDLRMAVPHADCDDACKGLQSASTGSAHSESHTPLEICTESCQMAPSLQSTLHCCCEMNWFCALPSSLAKAAQRKEIESGGGGQPPRTQGRKRNCGTSACLLHCMKQ